MPKTFKLDFDLGSFSNVFLKDTLIPNEISLSFQMKFEAIESASKLLGFNVHSNTIKSSKESRLAQKIIFSKDKRVFSLFIVKHLYSNKVKEISFYSNSSDYNYKTKNYFKIDDKFYICADNKEGFLEILDLVLDHL